EINWLDLPDHILSLIADLLNREKDLIHFGAVCHPWQSVCIDTLTRRRSHRLPLLMFATEYYQDDQTRSFYNLTDSTVYDAQVQVPHNMHCPGSSHGWLFTVCPKTFKVPFLSSNNEITLPPLTAFQHGFVGDNILENFYVGFLEKAVLSSNPASDPNYVIMAINNGSYKLAFYKPGDNVWTSLDSRFVRIVDIIYYRDRFYVINREGQVFSFDFNHEEAPKVSTIALHPPEGVRADQRYLVESSGYLLQLDPIEQKWVELDNLGGRILFLGHNTSLSVSASDFPECKPNSIYFTDDYYDGYYEESGFGGHDMGVYDLKNRTIEWHYPTEAKWIYPPPVWIERPLRWNL
ncbi:hypothetical protein AQUCO_00700051v1, partial [Aquilegia coerulea]